MSKPTCPKCGCPLEEEESCPRCMLLLAAEPTGTFAADPNGIPDIDNAVLKALHKEREKRQQSAEELKNEITAVENATLTQSQQSSETALQTFLNTPLWIFLAVCLGLYFVIPALTLLVTDIVDFFDVRSPVRVINPQDFRFSMLSIVILITTIAMIRYWRLNIPKQRHDKFIIAIIAALGFTIPYIASGIGTVMYGYKPWFYAIGITDTIAVISAVVMYKISGRFGNRLRYLPIICGYTGWTCLYISISGIAQGSFEIVDISFYSIYFFIGGYWMAWIIYAKHRRISVIYSILLTLVMILLWCCITPKSEISSVTSDVTLYYRGLGFSDSDNILGKMYYKTIGTDGSAGYWVTYLHSVGINRDEGFYANYEGFYANGQLKEYGEIFVEYFGYPKKPFPDRHKVWNGRYYRPDGTLGSIVSQGTGTQTLWYSNGRIKWECELVNGDRVRAKSFSEEGKIIANAEYVDGKEVYIGN